MAFPRLIMVVEVDLYLDHFLHLPYPPLLFCFLRWFKRRAKATKCIEGRQRTRMVEPPLPHVFPFPPRPQEEEKRKPHHWPYLYVTLVDMHY